MSAYFREMRNTLAGILEFLPQNRRSEILLDCGPSRLYPLAAVKRIFPCDAFSPCADAVYHYVNQQNAAAVDTPETRFKKMDERHLNFTECYRFNLHLGIQEDGFRLAIYRTREYSRPFSTLQWPASISIS